MDMSVSSTQLVPVWVKLLTKKAVIIQIIKTKTAEQKVNSEWLHTRLVKKLATCYEPVLDKPVVFAVFSAVAYDENTVVEL